MVMLQQNFFLFKIFMYNHYVFVDIFLKGMIIVKIKTVSYIRELSYPERNLTKRLVALCEKEVSALRGFFLLFCFFLFCFFGLFFF